MEMRTDDMPFVTSHLEFDAMGAHEGVAPKGGNTRAAATSKTKILTYSQQNQLSLSLSSCSKISGFPMFAGSERRKAFPSLRQLLFWRSGSLSYNNAGYGHGLY